MAYLLNNDKSENFECKLSLEGAELSDSKARILIEAGGYNLLYEGVINSDGQCNVEIAGLKKLFPTETTGNMRLEVIAEDTYFSPWEESCTIRPSKVLTVETVKTPAVPSKPKMQIEVKAKPTPKPKPSLSQLCETIKSKGFTKEVINKNKKKAIPALGRVIQEYYKSFDATPQKGIIKEILNKL
jgi:hypothetical protein